MERYITQLSHKNPLDDQIIQYLNSMKEYNGVGGYLRDAVREKFLRGQGQQVNTPIQYVTYNDKTAMEAAVELQDQYDVQDEYLSQVSEEDPAEKRKRLLNEAFNRL